MLLRLLAAANDLGGSTSRLSTPAGLFGLARLAIENSASRGSSQRAAPPASGQMISNAFEPRAGAAPRYRAWRPARRCSDGHVNI